MAATEAQSVSLVKLAPDHYEVRMYQVGEEGYGYRRLTARQFFALLRRGLNELDLGEV